jgi:hypothetical protein
MARVQITYTDRGKRTRFADGLQAKSTRNGARGENATRYRGVSISTWGENGTTVLGWSQTDIHFDERCGIVPRDARSGIRIQTYL